MDSPLDAPLTPRIENKKRRSITGAVGGLIGHCYNTTSSSSSSSTNHNIHHGNSDSFDCQTLQRCLKKVRLTTTITPGELRLQRDLNHAVLSRQWFPVVSSSISSSSTSSTSANTAHGAKNQAVSPASVRGEECEWIIPYQPSPMSNSSSSLQSPPVMPNGQSIGMTNTSTTMMMPRRSAVTATTDSFRQSLEEMDEEDFIMSETQPLPHVDYRNDSLVHESSSSSSLSFIDPNRVSVKVTRDEQDPMELVLHIDVRSFHPIAMSHAYTTSTVTSVSLHLQFPRMYPHRPPVVRRIEYHDTRSRSQTQTSSLATAALASNRWTAGNLTDSNWSHKTTVAPSLAPCKLPLDETNATGPTNNVHPHYPTNVLQRIIIAASPDCATSEVQNAAAAATGAAVGINSTNPSGISSGSGTVVWTEWSPVSRLTDICEWLVQTVVSWHLNQEQSLVVAETQVQHQTTNPSNRCDLGRNVEAISTSDLLEPTTSVRHSSTTTSSSSSRSSSSSSSSTSSNSSDNGGDSSPSTPTTNNCSSATVTLRHRIMNSEEKKDTEDDSHNPHKFFWGSAGTMGDEDDNDMRLSNDAVASADSTTSTFHPMAFASNLNWNSAITGNPHVAAATDCHGRVVEARLSDSSQFLPNGRFDMGYERQSSNITNSGSYDRLDDVMLQQDGHSLDGMDYYSYDDDDE